MGDIQILDSNGRPMLPAVSKASMIAGGTGMSGSTPRDAADRFSPRMGDWQPFLASVDFENNTFRDTITARNRDIVRNDGWAHGAIMRVSDSTIGSSFRPISKPDYRALEHFTGSKKFDAVWAAEFGRALDSRYRTWAEDSNHYCDAAMRLTMSQIFGLAFRHKIIDGDALATMLWMPERLGVGKARYCTAVQLIDPDRLSNPQNTYDTHTTRGGVIVGHEGQAEAYMIRRAHAGDYFNASDSMRWDRIPRMTPDGRALVVHDFSSDRAGQHRGGYGILTPVLQKLKMLYTYDNAELDQAIINSIFGTFIKSPFDPELVQSALGNDSLGGYQQMRGEFHNKKQISLGGAKIPHLFPGEDLVSQKAEHPSSGYPDFQKAVLRNIAQATGLSEMEASGNWADSTYSAARGALENSYQSMIKRRNEFGTGFAQPIFTCFAEESFEVDDLPLPSGAPDFIEMRQAYSACKFLGVPKGSIDKQKEAEGSAIGMSIGITTLAEEAEEAGREWEEVLDQRALEIERFKKLGIPVPVWAAKVTGDTGVEKIG